MAEQLLCLSGARGPRIGSRTMVESSRRPALFAAANHTTRRRRLSSITRAPCRKVMGVRHQKDAPAAGAGRGFKRHSYAVGLRPTLTIYTCWLTRILHEIDCYGWGK